MIERRTKIAYNRCLLRWTVRDYMRVPRRSLFILVDLASNTEPPEHMNNECNAYNRIMTYRKWVKHGTDEYIRAWWKVRGYKIDQK